MAYIQFAVSQSNRGYVSGPLKKAGASNINLWMTKSLMAAIDSVLPPRRRSAGIRVMLAFALDEIAAGRLTIKQINERSTQND